MEYITISPGPEEQMQEQMQEPEIVETPWYAHPSTIGPIAAATIVAIVGPLLVWKVKTISRKKKNNG
jgi:hypothetical protein